MSNKPSKELSRNSDRNVPPHYPQLGELVSFKFKEAGTITFIGTIHKVLDPGKLYEIYTAVHKPPNSTLWPLATPEVIWHLVEVPIACIERYRRIHTAVELDTLVEMTSEGEIADITPVGL